MNTPVPQKPSSIEAQLAENIVSNSAITFNLGQNVISTTEDKIRLAVLTHLGRIEQRQGWVAPAGIFITILAAFVTADFKDAWLPAATWRAIFVMSGIMSFVWLAVAIVRALRAPSVDDFINTLRSSAR